MVITDRALACYTERVEPVDRDKARASIAAAGHAVNVAARFGCSTVVLGNGARLQLQGDVVATVLPKRYGRRRTCRA